MAIAASPRGGGMRPARAFTLVELLVVMAVIGVLVAPLAAGRPVGTPVGATVTMRQQSQANRPGGESYHTSFGTFPLGNVTLTQGVCHGASLPGLGYPSQDGPNWLILLLPFVDQQVVYDNYDFHAFNESAQNVLVQQASVATYVCPSDQNTDRLTVPASGPACGPARIPGTHGAVMRRSPCPGNT